MDWLASWKKHDSGYFVEIATVQEERPCEKLQQENKAGYTVKAVRERTQVSLEHSEKCWWQCVPLDSAEVSAALDLGSDAQRPVDP